MAPADSREYDFQTTIQKHSLTDWASGSLFADAELVKDQVENVLDIDPPEQAPQSITPSSQLLSRYLLTLTNHRGAPSQRLHGLLQQYPLPFPSDQATLVVTEKSFREVDQGGHELSDAVAPGRGNPEGWGGGCHWSHASGRP